MGDLVRVQKSNFLHRKILCPGTKVSKEHCVVANVMNKVIYGRKRGIQWRTMERLEDLDFDDDNCLVAQRWSDIKAK